MHTFVGDVPQQVRFIIGIDEAGRGPIAGPVAVGAVLLPRDYIEKERFRDSKQLPQHKREQEFASLVREAAQGEARFSVAQTSARAIDKRGIQWAVSDAIARALSRLSVNPQECLVLLDGGLRAPSQFRFQKTIIKGDERVYAIALASIVAKVTRDEHMRRASLRYPGYGFEQHKGYGTKEHYRSLRARGMSALHRTSFLKRLTTSSVHG